MGRGRRAAYGLVWTLYGGYALVIAVTLLVAGLPAAGRIRRDALEEIAQSLRRQAALVEQVVGAELEAVARGEARPGAARELQAQLARLGLSGESRITLVLAGGAVLADSVDDPARMEDHLDRPEIREAARTRRAAVADRRSGTTGTHLMYVALPVVRGEELLGFVRTSRSLTSIEGRLRGIHATFLLAGGLAAAVALLLGLYLARQFTAPLRSMTRVAEAIAGGAHDRRVRSHAPNEIGRLARAFDAMAEELGERLETITTERNRMQAILSGMVEGVVAIDQGERVVHMNRVAERLLRVQPGLAAGAPIWEVTRLEEVHQALRRAMTDGEKLRGELHRAGSLDEQHLEMEASPLFDGRGKVVGSVLVLHDVTELRTLENIRRDFVANVSHELKTPLTAIRGMVETLIEDAEMDPAVRQRFLGRVFEQTLRLSALVVDLLALSRLESERELDLEEIELGALVTGCGREQQVNAERAGIELQLELPGEPVVLLGDQEDLRQMINNLVDNALKYTPAGGRAGVRLRLSNGRARLDVWDTGIGIEPADQERIFERFYRVDKARSRELGGTGLGLSIVKHVALKHRGKLALQSRPGHGTTFTVELPVVGA
jgi:two-component system, OmpR family, phosphate regulon sensor histidine kinase PhoR